MQKDSRKRCEALRVVGLFAGIGGFELGLHQAGLETVLLCESEPSASAVLAAQFSNIPITGDVRDLRAFPEADVVAAGFPCQDLSQAGMTAGIGGSKSGVVAELFRLLDDHHAAPRWLLLENVPFMLQLQRGRAMEYLTDRLEKAGFSWAYRVVDAQSFGLPQRRQRVLLLASRTEDPRTVLFRGRRQDVARDRADSFPLRFSTGPKGTVAWVGLWTPCRRSRVGRRSEFRHRPRSGCVIRMVKSSSLKSGTPSVCRAFPTTGPPRRSAAKCEIASDGNWWEMPSACRWRTGLVVACVSRGHTTTLSIRPCSKGAAWPKAAWGIDGKRFAASLSPWPVNADYQHLGEFLRYPPKRLSYRASSGFHQRATGSCLKFVDGFLEAVKVHSDQMAKGRVRAATDG